MIKGYLILVLFGLSLIACNETKQKEVSKNTKPNIIYILADDLGYGDVGYLGQQKFETPNIDKLAAEGLVFTQHYSGATVCAPSRSALLTGMHTGHTIIRGNKEVRPEGQHPMPANTFTLSKMLKDAGYKTSVYGKWGLGFPGSEGDPNKQGFDEFYGYNCQRIAHNYYPYYIWHNQEKVVLEGNEGKGQEVYAPDLIHDKALEFIEKNKDSSFFMFYATPLPHAELLLPEKYVNKYKGKLLPETKHEGVDDGPTYKNGGYGSQENPHAAFAAMINHLDSQVGDIVNKLEKLGIADNTIIIFTSDNGPHREGGADPEYFDSNGIYKGFKRDLYEGGIHVPMIAKWPNKIKPGTSTDHISAFWDILPTFAEVADVEIDKNLDGISFLPTLLNKEGQKAHEYLYWEFHEKGGRIGIRKGKWKGVKYDVLKSTDKKIQLYNLETDPEENNDLASEYPEIAKELYDLMMSARTHSDIFKFESETFLNVK